MGWEEQTWLYPCGLWAWGSGLTSLSVHLQQNVASTAGALVTVNVAWMGPSKVGFLVSVMQMRCLPFAQGLS